MNYNDIANLKVSVIGENRLRGTTRVRVLSSGAPEMDVPTCALTLIEAATVQQVQASPAPTESSTDKLNDSSIAVGTVGSATVYSTSPDGSNSQDLKEPRGS